MKLSIEHDALLNTLTRVRSVVSARIQIPILGHVLLQADNDRLQIRSTDLDMEVIASVPANIETAGATTVSAGTFFDVVRKLPKDYQISLSVTPNPDGLEYMEIKSGRSNFSLTTLSQDEFPLMASEEYETNFTMPLSLLQHMFNKVKHAISVDETRMYLLGIWMHLADSESDGRKVLRCVSTDGHQLGCIDTDLPANAANMPGVIVPRKTVTELLRLQEQEDTEIRISVMETKVRFATEDFTLTSKVIDGNFPDYRRVIPKDNNHKMKVNAADLAAAAERAATVSDEKSRIIELHLKTDSLKLLVNANNNNRANEELAVAYNGEPMKTGYNVQYLLAVLSQMKSDSATFSLKTGIDPVVIHEDDDPNVLHVIMPVRVA